jgi:hypothetical protein
MSLQIMSRLHKLYDRVVHRGDTAQSSVPEPVDDTTTTLRIVRDEEIEVAADLDSLDVDQLAYGEDATPSDSTEVSVNDGGDLYGVHVAPASDRAQLDDDHAFDQGQNWLESLETHAAEGGPEPEHELDIVDEEDGTPSSDSRDRPVADRGSAGPRGL